MPVIKKNVKKIEEAPVQIAKEPEQPVSMVVEKVSRKELARLIQVKLQASGKAAPIALVESMVKAYEESVADVLRDGGLVQLTGFGTFSVSHKEATVRPSPQTGEPMTIASRNAPKFKVGTALKNAVNAE